MPFQNHETQAAYPSVLMLIVSAHVHFPLIHVHVVHKHFVHYIGASNIGVCIQVKI